MTSTLLATLLVSLRRARAAWPIVLAAGLTCLLATTLLAAGPIYADAVSQAGLRRVMADAPVADANVEITLRAERAAAREMDEAVITTANAALTGLDVALVHTGRSGTFDLPVDEPGPVPDLVELAALEGIEAHATLLDGAWPTTDTAESVPVAVVDQAATPLGLAVGDTLRLASRRDPERTVDARIVGIFAINDPEDRYWWGDAQTIDGVRRSEDFATHGPFFTTMDEFLEHDPADRVELGWRIAVDPASVTLDELAAMRARLEALDGQLEAATGAPVTVTTDIPALFAETERSLLVSRTGVLLLTAQLAILAAYAVLLSATLLVDHRRMDTAMLRSRGAGPAQLAGLTLVEGLLLTVPAALLAPFVAVLALRGFEIAGPLTAIGLRIEPTVSIDAFAAATAGALGCLFALVLPALPSRRSFAAVRQGTSRASTVPTGQRLGLDIALVAIAGLGLWQLRHYGAPLTRDLGGELGIDPLLVATPAIGLLAGAVVTLRVLPMLARIMERLNARGRGLVGALGARQLARRPLRYTRASLLLTLAMAMGVFAVSYTYTWTTSQSDQAAYQVGADLRVVPATGSTALPRWALDRAYAAVPGLEARTPVDQVDVRATRAARGTIMAVDAATAGSIITLRSDLSDEGLEPLMGPLAAARPDVPAATLPDGVRTIRLAIQPDIRAVDRAAFDPELEAIVVEPADPGILDAVPGIEARVVIRDAAGVLHRFGGATTTLAPGSRTVDVALGDPDERRGVMAAPLQLIGVELDVRIAADLEITDGTIAVDSVEAAPLDGPFIPVDLAIDGGWRLRSSIYGLPFEPVEGGAGTADGLAAETGGSGLRTFRGEDQYGRGTVVAFSPSALTDAGDAGLTAIATDAFLAATAQAIGDEVPVEIDGVRRTVLITAAIRGIPTVPAEEPALLVDLASLALVRFEGSGSVDPPAEWWFTVGDDEREAAIEALRAAPLSSRSVDGGVERARELATDPVALGIIGALAIGTVAAGLFAIVGFIVSAAVSARERVTEFALLRALGLSPSQLAGWLSLENAVLASVSLVAGTLLGLLLAWVVLPFVTVTQGASTPYPPVALDVPWSLIAILELTAIVALATTVVVLAVIVRRMGLASALRMGED